MHAAFLSCLYSENGGPKVGCDIPSLLRVLFVVSAEKLCSSRSFYAMQTCALWICAGRPLRQPIRMRGLSVLIPRMLIRSTVHNLVPRVSPALLGGGWGGARGGEGRETRSGFVTCIPKSGTAIDGRGSWVWLSSSLSLWGSGKLCHRRDPGNEVVPCVTWPHVRIVSRRNTHAVGVLHCRRFISTIIRFPGADYKQQIDKTAGLSDKVVCRHDWKECQTWKRQSAVILGMICRPRRITAGLVSHGRITKYHTVWRTWLFIAGSDTVTAGSLSHWLIGISL